MSGHYNRAARRSGGERPARFYLPNLSRADLEILQQEAVVREQFGEEGVRLFWQRLPESDIQPKAGGIRPGDGK